MGQRDARQVAEHGLPVEKAREVVAELQQALGLRLHASGEATEQEGEQHGRPGAREA